jgi:hypothetical protein
MTNVGRRWSAAHVRLIALYGSRFAIRTGGGLVFLLIVLLAGLGVASVFIAPVESTLRTPEGREMFGEGTPGEQADRILKSGEVSDVVRWVTGGDATYANYLLRENPALLSAIFLILLIGFPYVVCFGAFNQTAGDAGSRGLRYLLLRTERPNIFFGRFLGTALFTVITTLLLVVVLLAYIGFKLKVYAAGSLLGWGLQCFLALAILSLPYTAMCAWLSSMLDSAFPALVICLLCVSVPTILLAAVDGALPGDQGWLSRILPWGWKFDLLSPDLATRATAMSVLLGFTAARSTTCRSTSPSGASRASSGRTARGRPRCSRSPPASSSRHRAPSKCSGSTSRKSAGSEAASRCCRRTPRFRAGFPSSSSW